MSENNSGVLVVGKNPHLRAALKDQLIRERFLGVCEETDFPNFVNALMSMSPDFILLDVTDGVEDYENLQKALTETNTVAKTFIMVDARDSKLLNDAIVHPFDELIHKPVYMNELLGKIKCDFDANLNSKKSAFFCGMKLNYVDKSLISRNQEVKLFLTEKEVQILECFSRNYPNPVSKKDLLANVWKVNKSVTTHTVETHIYRLRKKLQKLDIGPLLVTTKKGYCLVTNN